MANVTPWQDSRGSISATITESGNLAVRSMYQPDGRKTIVVERADVDDFVELVIRARDQMRKDQAQRLQKENARLVEDVKKTSRDFADEVIGLVVKYKTEHKQTLSQLGARLVVGGITFLKLAKHTKEAIQHEINNSLDRNWDKLNFGSFNDPEIKVP